MDFRMAADQPYSPPPYRSLPSSPSSSSLGTTLMKRSPDTAPILSRRSSFRHDEESQIQQESTSQGLDHALDTAITDPVKAKQARSMNITQWRYFLLEITGVTFGLCVFAAVNPLGQGFVCRDAPFLAAGLSQFNCEWSSLASYLFSSLTPTMGPDRLSHRLKRTNRTE